MDDMDHPLLSIGTKHRNRDDAKQYVESLANAVEIQIPSLDNYDNDVFFDLNGYKKRVNFAASIFEAETFGVPRMLQSLFDNRDRYLNPAIQMAIGIVVPIPAINISTKIGSFQTGGYGPGITESVEQSLTDDILYYRKEACFNSSGNNLQICTRFYRSYLHSCISLIDCFIFRYAAYVKDEIPDFEKYSNTKVLGSIAGIEKRIEAWIITFATDQIDKYKTTKEWAEFQEIRKLRNEFMHSFEPARFYSIKQIAYDLNLCRKGIGGLLATFRQYSKYDPRLGFIQKIMTAPIVSFDNKVDT